MDEESDTDSHNESESEWEAESTGSSSGSDWQGENYRGKKAQRGQKRKMKTRNCKETGPSSLCTSNKKRQTEDSRQPVGQKSKENSQLPVTCGDKEGVLYLDKFHNTEKCILSEEQWLKPTEFEKFGGMGKNKKWKTSILCNGIPLQILIEDGFLSFTFRKREVQDRQCRTKFPPLKDPSSRSDGQSSEGRGNGHYEDKDNSSDGDGDIDMTMFKGPTLPVTCGSDSGVLHKNRFASGHCGKCIRTNDFWLTPEDFVRLSKPEGAWRKDIEMHGLPLGKLLMNRVLVLHMINCECDICQDLGQYSNDDVCYVCNSEGDLLCCDECPRAFHPGCHLPAVEDDSLGGQWSCTFCVMKNMQVFSQKTQQDVLSSPVSQYRLYCRFLLLCLLHESTANPNTEVPGYSKDISGPMMLGRAKLNLENNDYQTVGEFVTDIEDVFQHCTSKRDNDFCGMTRRLKELFKREFKSIFKII
ncbi:nuclear body protein SP140-like protein isoform X1 [Myxocyprinus asiaticus]|uniref:nuclear body protein SP140-like protein isoform X1 n=2 Tax=Myxocyprinus asiaticus TaxID=70543 RepID=UPI0022227872|nr:nuclear body protein SP140-like protein isoform X1 [Myxocyprinus asiaticus]XP_051570956.1 nuclear body protein SP140-like protein isoform X1 [Myxocyprinus asiaticus]